MVINPAWLRWVLRHFRVSPGWNQGVGWAGIFLYSLGKNLLSGSFWSLHKFSFLWLKDGGSLFSCLFSAGGLSQFKTSCILSHVDDSIFKPATVCQISMCCESPWFPILLLARGNLLLLKGSPDWLGPIQIDSDFQINSLGFQLSAQSLPRSTWVYAWSKNWRTGISGRKSLEFCLPWCWWGWCQLMTQPPD